MNHSIDKMLNEQTKQNQELISNHVSWSWLDRFMPIRQSCEELVTILDTPAAKARLKSLCKKYYANVFKHYQHHSETTNHLYRLPIQINESNNVLSIHDRWHFQDNPIARNVSKVDELHIALGSCKTYAAVTKAQIEKAFSDEGGTTLQMQLRIQEVGLYVLNHFQTEKSATSQYVILSNIKRQPVDFIVAL